MARQDRHGRDYARLDALKAGDLVELDDGFTCHPPGIARIAAGADGFLYFACDGGHHVLTGQLDDDGYLIGIYPAPEAKAP